MKPIRLSRDVVSVGELKANASKLLDRIRSAGRPIVITQHGRPAAILISTEDYDRFMEQAWFVLAVEEGISQSRDGRLVEDPDLDAEIAGALAPGGGP
jgi:prevent-host-death family protein